MNFIRRCPSTWIVVAALSLLQGTASAGPVGPGMRMAAPYPARASVPPVARPQTQFNRESLGPASGVKAPVRARAYRLLDSESAPGPKPQRKAHRFENDGRNGDAVLPKKTADGRSIQYTTRYLRPQRDGRTLRVNARVVTGRENNSAYLSKHYKTHARIQ